MNNVYKRTTSALQTLLNFTIIRIERITVLTLLRQRQYQLHTWYIPLCLISELVSRNVVSQLNFAS